MTKQPTATVHLTTWELVAIEQALDLLMHINPPRLKALQDKIRNAVPGK